MQSSIFATIIFLIFVGVLFFYFYGQNLIPVQKVPEEIPTTTITTQTTTTTKITSSNVRYIKPRYVNVTAEMLAPNLHWDHMPLSVFFDIESGKRVTFFNEDRIAEVRKAMQTWKEKSNDVIEFVETNNSQEADIIVKWIGFSKDAVQKGFIIQGETQPIITSYGEFNIFIKSFINITVTPDVILNRNIAIHEIGHALGFDHTDDPHDIMYPIADANQMITKKEIETLDILYG